MFASLSLDVIDPCNRTGKISIPMEHVVPTKGVSDFRANPAKRDGKELSLCLLFQKGRCNAGNKCHQVHADADYVTSLRDRAAAAKNCCALHGDVHSTGFINHPTLLVGRVLNGEDERKYSLDSFGRTSCLDSLMRSAKNGEVRIPANKICRLHAQSRCKFGKDCKNVHLCCDAKPLQDGAPAALRTGMFASATSMKAPAPIHVDTSCCGLSAAGQSSNKSSQVASRCDSPIVAPLPSYAATTTTAVATTVCQPLELTSMMSSHQEFSFFSTSCSNNFSPKFDLTDFESTIRGLCQDLTKDDPLAVSRPANSSRW